MKASYTITHNESIKEKLRETKLKICDYIDKYRIRYKDKDGESKDIAQKTEKKQRGRDRRSGAYRKRKEGSGKT